MRVGNHAAIRNYSVIKMAVCAFLLGAAVNMFAKNADKQSERPPVRVVSHLALQGAPARQMVLQQENGHEYLYMVQSSGRGFTVVDVSKPNDPNIVKKVDLPSGRAVDLEMLGTSMGIAEETGTTARTANQQPESVQFFDLSDPANPRPVKTFTGVTSVLSEDGRHLVYIANNDGLWILRRPTKPTDHPCTSSDQISGMPECY